MDNLNKLITEGEFDKVVIILERRLLEGDFTFVNNLIQAYLNIGCIDKAIELHNQVIKQLNDNSNHWILMELGRALIKHKRILDLEVILNYFAKTENHMIKVVRKSLLLELATLNNEFEVGSNYLEMKSNWSHLFNNSACHELKKIAFKYNVQHIKKINQYAENYNCLIGMSVDSLAYYGRFGHQLSEYLLIRLMSDKYNIPLETPEWIGDYVFELNDCENKYYRKTVKYNAVEINRIADSSFGVDLNGLDFFSPGSLLKYDIEIIKKSKEIFVFRPHITNILEKLTKLIKKDNKIIIAFHLRFGDRAETLSKTNSIDCYLNWLSKNWLNYPNACFYIASDNIEYAKDKFSNYNVLCINDFQIEYPELDWLYDFYVLCNANVVGISHSGFSIMSSIINNVSGVEFYQPNSLIKDLVPFYPQNLDLTNFNPGATIVL